MKLTLFSNSVMTSPGESGLGLLGGALDGPATGSLFRVSTLRFLNLGMGFLAGKHRSAGILLLDTGSIILLLMNGLAIGFVLCKAF